MMAPITLRSLELDTHEVTFVIWHKSVGDRIAEGEVIAEVMTDKANVEVQAPASGILIRTDARPDEVLPIDSIVGMIRRDGDS